MNSERRCRRQVAAAESARSAEPLAGLALGAKGDVSVDDARNTAGARAGTVWVEQAPHASLRFRQSSETSADLTMWLGPSAKNRRTNAASAPLRVFLAPRLPLAVEQIGGATA